jgi:ubiquinone biosynthesis protein
MIQRRVRGMLAVSPLAARIYFGLRTIGWWRQRRRSALSWTDELIPIVWSVERDVPPRPFGDVQRQITSELGRPLADVFTRLEPRPVACTSLTQVHTGELCDGRPVAVKVQHRNYAKRVGADLWMVNAVLRLLARFDRAFDFRPVIDEIGRASLDLADYDTEARNQEVLAENLAHRGDVFVPRVIREYSTSRLLVMEWADGVPAADADALRAAGIEPADVARLVSDCYSEQLIAHGLFHADLHPGNFLVRTGPQLVLLDFGLCRSVDDRFRLALCRLLKAMTGGDSEAMLTAVEDLGVRSPSDADRSSLLSLVLLFADLLRAGGYAGPDFLAEARTRLNGSAPRHPVREIPPELLLILRQVGLLGWLGARLGSPVNLLEASRPYVEAILTGEMEGRG